MYYIFKPDRVGYAMLGALCDAVQRGVDVRLMVDSLGSISPAHPELRALETCADEQGVLHAAQGDTDLFVYPGYHFKGVDALITNFHLPRSSLLLLVSAFAGRESVLDAYKDAVERKYRFYSYGDAMLIV